MGRGSFKLFVLFLLCSFFSSFVVDATSSSNNVDMLQSECLTVSTTEFLGTLKSTMDLVSKVSSILSKFGNFFGDFRVSNAVSDCLDLLDLSANALDWTISASQKPNKGKNNSTGNLSSDLRTWLSSALVNQDTCMDGFEGTNTIVKNVIGGSLGQLTSLVRQALVMVDPTPNKNSSKGSSSGRGGHVHPEGRKLRGDEEDFPYWMKKKDRKLLQSSGGGGVAADAVVAADGTSNFTRIQDAVAAAPDSSSKRFVIYIKKGVYKENVEISKKKWNIMMVGDGIDVTVISGNRNFIDGWTTYRSATFAVKGRGFIAGGITFENTAGPEKHQAVAYRSDSDLSVLYRCAMRGYQDTLYAHSMRQFFRECTITGTVDFMFGDATAVFQNCQILARKGLPNQKNTITAQGRKDPTEPTGFAIQFSNFSGEPELLASKNTTLTYLGRPWKLYSRTVIMQSLMSDVIRPEGWLEWNGNFALDSLYYAEYMNYGPGGGVGSRVKWPGYHLFNSSGDANKYTVSQFLLGNSWLPSTGVKFTAGLAV